MVRRYGVRTETGSDSGQVTVTRKNAHHARTRGNCTSRIGAFINERNAGMAVSVKGVFVR